MTSTNDRISHNFTSLLALKNLTIPSVAELAGVPYQSLARASRGATRWRVDLVDAAAVGLGVDPLELILGHPAGHAESFLPSRDGPAALRAIADHLEAQAVAQVAAANHLTALHQAIAAQDIRAALTALSALGERWDDEG